MSSVCCIDVCIFLQWCIYIYIYVCIFINVWIISSRIIMKMKNMHICIYIYINVDIWISLKRMMKACLSLSFAVVHSRHVVHVCACLSCAARTRDRWSCCCGSMSISSSASSRQGGEVYRAEIGNMQGLCFVFRVLPTACSCALHKHCIFLRYTQKKTYSMIRDEKIRKTFIQ